MRPYEKSKEIRINKNIPTYELSELTGIPQSTISKIENSKRKIETESLQKLANTLHVSINDFLIMRIL
ncbi:helix-turn-helix domain-containing protein [Clostridium botulinum]|uniref:Helix-turn-helix transcriptional regulator n=1 Tax=Clostridium botulinum TaxID=1491 RepID=A0ABD7CGV1_CLOBO|nr:helix-turn-helix transcriptional regulator [Clostridium botulinum]KGO14380.1 XRE family transcriptional regulator [Clostridium botulinum]KIN80303.1 XRE family transcriptional regulator [Clostridium botulinum]MCC5426404.1 helix-turn-helix transcriptional regulator [Clostridium botulinum]QRI52475.1 helix-turn-helix transcriptional regulator [Clostridium botulinum]